MSRAPIAVFFALDVESGYFIDRLKESEHTHAANFDLAAGKINETNFLVVSTGAGMQDARRVAEVVCRIHQPRMVISAGFAGALHPELQKYALFLPSEVVLESEEKRTFFSKLQPSDFPKELRTEMTFGGRLLTAARVIAKSEEKQRLGAKTGAIAVDMETFAVAELCAELDLPFLAVRVVSDAADENLPNDVQTLVEQKTTFSRWGAALQMMFQRPSSVCDMYRLYEGSVESAVRLADFLEAFASLEQLQFLSENFFPPQNPPKLLEKDS